MNQNKRDLGLSINALSTVLEALEEYVRKGNYYADWTSKEQFYYRTMPRNETTLEKAKEHFFSQFWVVSTLSFNEEMDKNLRQATQKEFYKWIDHSGITAENCPEKLKHFLNEINEALESGNSRLYQAYEVAREKENRFFLDLKNPLHRQAYLEVNKDFGYVSQTEKEQQANFPKYYEVKIEGDAEQGQATFQQIKNSIISQPEWTFPLRERYYQKLKEKITDLETKKDWPQPKEMQKREIILDTFEDILRDVELYIKKLNYYPNWKVSEWTGEGEDYLLNNWENKSSEEIKDKILTIDLRCLSGILKIFKKNDPNYYPNLVEELKIKLSQWQSERKISANNCPKQLKQVLSTINEVLENSGNYWKGTWKENKDEKGKNEGEQEKIVKIIVKLKLEIAELMKKFKIRDLVPDDWQDKLMNSKSFSEAKSYQRQIEQKNQAEKAKHQVSATTNENRLSLPAKIAIGFGIIGLGLGAVVLIYQVVKNRKVKK